MSPCALIYLYEANAYRCWTCSSYYTPVLAYVAVGLEAATAFNCSGVHYPAHIAPWFVVVCSTRVQYSTHSSMSCCRGLSGSRGPSPFGDWGLHSNGVFALLPFLWHWE